jgi:deoxycytidylate deaminase
MCRQERFIRIASKIAQKSEHHYPIGAAVVKGNRVLATGVNLYKSHPLQEAYEKDGDIIDSSSIHAEVAAIRKLPRNILEGATIYVARLLANGSNGLSKPCSGCMMRIKKSGIKKVVYTTNGSYESIVIR